MGSSSAKEFTRNMAIDISNQKNRCDDEIVENDSCRFCRVLLNIDFELKKCFSAFNVTRFSQFAEEAEILILFGTFFEMTKIVEHDHN